MVASIHHSWHCQELELSAMAPMSVQCEQEQN